MTNPTPAEQLLNLADRAERHALTGAEAARLRDGISLLAELLRDAEGDRDSWATEAKQNETEAEVLRRERHTYQRAWHAARDRARKERTRAEQAEAALSRVRAIADDCASPKHRGAVGIPHPVIADVLRAALDEHQEQPLRDEDDTPICTCTYSQPCPACLAATT